MKCSILSVLLHPSRWSEIVSEHIKALYHAKNEKEFNSAVDKFMIVANELHDNEK